jgi:predicted DNA-binding transcriptional regulator YafY
MTAGEHDTLVYRLSQILLKLNQGEKLSSQSLADEFGVTLRTIQRDLNVRFAYLPLEKIKGLYSLDPIYLGKLSRKDIDRFASLAGVKGLFPSLNDDFLREIFANASQSALLVKGHNYEDLTGTGTDFSLIRSAISARNNLSFNYKSKSKWNDHPQVSPYKLLNHHGIWYLVAVENEKVKTFAFKKLSNLKELESTFNYDANIEKRLIQEDGIWFSQKDIKVTLKVSKEISGYFERRKLIANQIIEQTLEDGSLILSTNIGHYNQVLPIIKYWIPHISIISPTDLKEELAKQLETYLQE